MKVLYSQSATELMHCREQLVLLDRGEQRANPGQASLGILRAELSRGLSGGMEIFESSYSWSLGGYRSL